MSDQIMPGRATVPAGDVETSIVLSPPSAPGRWVSTARPMTLRHEGRPFVTTLHLATWSRFVSAYLPPKWLVVADDLCAMMSILGTTEEQYHGPHDLVPAMRRAHPSPEGSYAKPTASRKSLIWEVWSTYIRDAWIVSKDEGHFAEGVE